MKYREAGEDSIMRSYVIRIPCKIVLARSDQGWWDRHDMYYHVWQRKESAYKFFVRKVKDKLCANTQEES
jgi:hypothetical protein